VLNADEIVERIKIACWHFIIDLISIAKF